MSIYNDLLNDTQSRKRLAKFEKVALTIIDSLNSTHPNLPEDYLSFLKEIGSGEIENTTYIIYNGTISPTEIYDETTAQDLENILIFGDDMQGCCFGFDTRHDWSVVEIDSTDMSCRKIFDCFSDFIREKLKEA